MKHKQAIIRQGDVVLVPIAEFPTDLKPKPRDNGRIILAYGEVTGHSHAIAAKHCEAWVDGAGVTMLEVRRAMALLEHDEHGAAKLPPGKYAVRIKRTYSRGEVRNVQD